MKATKITIRFDWEMRNEDDHSLVWGITPEAVKNAKKRVLKQVIRTSPDRKARKQARSELAEVR